MFAARAMLWAGLAILCAASPTQAAPGMLRAAELVVGTGHPKVIAIPLARGNCPAGDTCLRGELATPELKITLSLGPGQRALPFEVGAQILTAAPVRLVAVRLHFTADGSQPLGRDYQPTVARRVVLDRFDPKWIGLSERGRQVAAVLVDNDVDTVTVTHERGAVVVELELFSSQARPFGHLPRCAHAWRDVHGMVNVPDRHLAAGDRLAGSGELVLGESPPVALSPWPEGRAAAFVITDHADQTSAETLHALLAGRSDADLDHPVGGLLAHKVPITKALFLNATVPHGWTHAQLEDERVAKLAERLRLSGGELSPHSATPLPDTRDVVDHALDWFGRHDSRVWIDHQPQTNCEGFGQAGWRTGSGIADLLEKHGFRDVWDVTEWHGAGLDERDPRHLDRRAPTLWPLGRLEPGGPSSLWMFRSTWAFLPRRAFRARYAERELDRLERDRGLHIAHTYLESLHPRGSMFGRRNLLDRTPDGAIALSPELDGLFASLAQRQARGSMWLAPLGVVADRMRALGQARIRVTESGAYRVTRPGALDALTLHVGVARHFASAATLRGQRALDGATRAWLAPCEGATCTSELILETR